MKFDIRSTVSLALAIVSALILLPGLAQAAPPSQYAEVFVEPDSLIVRPLVPHASIIVVLRASDGCVVTRSFKSSGQVVVPLVDDEGKTLRDGNVTWEVQLPPKIDRNTQAALDQARKAGNSKFAIQLKDEGILPWYPQVQSGNLRIDKGVAQDPDVGGEDRVAADPEASRGVFADTADAGFLAEEQTIAQSLCVGFDCPANPSFGFDTLRLQENNLRIHFEDTSTAASFPRNDWRIQANDSANGGGSYLAIVDASSSRTVFQVTAGARSNALVVDAQGDVGIGTATPVVDVHAVTGDTPTLRLEQDGSSGFAAQTWDVAGNETNFFVRDVSNGSTLPFRIQPGAGTSALYIASDDQIGFGTQSPDASLHVEVNEGSNFGGLRVENSGAGNIQTQFASTDGAGWEWRQTFRSGDLIFDSQEDGANELELTIAGDLTVVSVTETSDRAMKENFSALDRQDVLAKIVELPITRWNYIEKGPDVEHIGPMAQDFYGAFGVGPDDKHIATRDAASVALVGVQALHDELRQRDARVEALEAANAALLERLEALEQRLAE